MPPITVCETSLVLSSVTEFFSADMLPVGMVPATVPVMAWTTLVMSDTRVAPVAREVICAGAFGHDTRQAVCLDLHLCGLQL